MAKVGGEAGKATQWIVRLMDLKTNGPEQEEAGYWIGELWEESLRNGTEKSPELCPSVKHMDEIETKEDSIMNEEVTNDESSTNGHGGAGPKWHSVLQVKRCNNRSNGSKVMGTKESRRSKMSRRYWSLVRTEIVGY